MEVRLLCETNQRPPASHAQVVDSDTFVYDRTVAGEHGIQLPEVPDTQPLI